MCTGHEGFVVDILWAEDSVQDQHLIRAALDETKQRAKVAFVEDGQALLEIVDAARPRLVVLDLQMPRLGGLETLQRLRQAPATRGLSVVVFTSSSHPRDQEECRRLNVVDYVTKPMEFGAFCTAVDRIAAAVKQSKVTA